MDPRLEERHFLRPSVVYARGRVPVEAAFVARPNRFVAIVRLSCDVEHAYGLDRAGAEITAHVADPGRLEELLIPGAKVYVLPAFPKGMDKMDYSPTLAGVGRKTLYDLVLVDYEGILVSIDSRVPNELVHRALQAGFFPELAEYHRIVRESAFGSSRFDFHLSAPGQVIGTQAAILDENISDCFVEVKSVTLVEDGLAKFPDAPTARGARHMRELAQAVSAGLRGVVIFVIQRNDASNFTPNRAMDPKFAGALSDSVEAGVEVWAWRCDVGLDRISLDAEVPVNI